jgi:predicted transcriptional regulator
MPGRFTFNDGWLLTVLWAGRDPIDREKLQGLADAFNHARFNADELDRSMGALVAAGLAHPTDGTVFHITEKGRDFVVAHWVRSDGHIRNMFTVADALIASSLYREPDL